MATYGVGPAASRTGTGPNQNMNSKMGAYGRVYDKGVLVADPTVDLIGQLQDDTFTLDRGTINATVVYTNPSSKSRFVFTALKSSASQSVLQWFNHIINDSIPVSGNVKVGTNTAVSAQTVTVTQTGTTLVAQFDLASDLATTQGAVNTAGSKGVVLEGDGESITFVVAPV